MAPPEYVLRVKSSPRRPLSAARARAVHDIRLLVATLAQSARSVERTSGMTNAQLFLLRQLADRDGQTINELAERAMTQQSAASLLVSRLESGGFVKRSPSRADRRRTEVRITPAGRRLASEAPAAPLERLLSSLGRLSVAELTSLQRGLDRLLEEMNVEGSNAPLLFEARPDARKRGR